MGLMLSILVGCVGVLELLACLRHVTNGVVITINQPVTPCLSYHEPLNDNMSVHDSICTYSHSSDANLPRAAKHKLENLHEYSLRIRAELRSLDKNFDYKSLSDFGGRNLLPVSRASPDSRLSPDFDYLVQVSESQPEEDDYRNQYERETSYEDAAENWRIESSSRDRPLSVTVLEPEKYIRVPTPIPFSLDDDISSSGASSDVGTSFDNDSGNEAPTMKTIDTIPVIKRYKSPSDGGSSIDESDYNEQKILPKKQLRKSRSRTPELRQGQVVEGSVEYLKSTENLKAESGNRGGPEEQSETIQSRSQKKKIKSSSTIVRKPTWLKSKNAEVSKSAENLNARKSKRHREPERRKSDISVQTGSSSLRDEWTNTSPVGSTETLSRSNSRKSVSVQVQTSFEEELASLEALSELEGSVASLTESRRDLSSRERFGRRSFKNRRFGSGSRDKASEVGDGDNFSVTNATASVERSKDEVRLLKISSFEEADAEDYQRVRNILTDPDSKELNENRRNGSKSLSSFEDDEYWDAEDVSAGRPIEYSIPDPDRNKAFWVMTCKSMDAPPVLSPRILVTLHLHSKHDKLAPKHVTIISSHPWRIVNIN